MRECLVCRVLLPAPAVRNSSPSPPTRPPLVTCPAAAEAALTPAARDFISRLLCDVEERLGSAGGSAQLRAHPFFAGVDWQRLYEARPPYRPAVEHELDTQMSGMGRAGQLVHVGMA